MFVVVKVPSDSGNSLLRSSGCQGRTCTSGLPYLECQVLGYSATTAASFFDESHGQDCPARVQGEKRWTAGFRADVRGHHQCHHCCFHTSLDLPIVPWKQKGILRSGKINDNETGPHLGKKSFLRRGRHFL